MTIQWYPGHMHKAVREFKETLGKVNLVIEIVDARIPFSSENPLLQKLRGNVPCIKVLNKSDLADPEIINSWQKYLNQQQTIHSHAVTKNQPDRIKELISLCRKSVNAESLPDKMITALVVGIPNVGKSTIINILAGRLIAKTGNEPAITKGQQRIVIRNNVVLIDTPGVLWPNLENQKSAYRLAATGAIKDTAINHEDVASFLMDYLLTHYPEAIKNRFNFDTLPKNVHALINDIGKNRGCLGHGGTLIQDKVAKVILTEFRTGQLGRVSLETPIMMKQELADLEIMREEKAINKEIRKSRQKNSRD